MNSVDVFIVIRDMGYDGEALAGIYQRKEDAEYIRDHLEAIRVNELWDNWKRWKVADISGEHDCSFDHYRLIFCERHDEFRVEEEDMYV
ncbi:hypothetical protein PMW_117 [Pseudomonas phage phiPMW]|uniref:Uncharacterized protein n=1 Tax=Pseudomonas phage phiPMW TaxID=1815582 RepID=A0A1S5R1E8_9CAUD|nr:hypothetical protein FDG97_gp117 [Pseudomonas phage phiPMW]ANA49242.1 hypothetical protein PMW_117 [Pseudomonas phage phiPMW]